MQCMNLRNQTFLILRGLLAQKRKRRETNYFSSVALVAMEE